jgi:hypothetical protein
MARKRTEIQEALAQQSSSTPLGYQQCEWMAGDERCRYPGTMSTNTHEGGPYYCRLHFGCDDGMWGATVVTASRDYVHPTPADINAAHAARANAYAAEQGLNRHPDESRQMWIRRVMVWVKSKQKGIGKLPERDEA